LNMVVSFYYYLRVVKAIFMDANDQPLPKISVPVSAKLALYICVTGIVITGFLSNVCDYIYSLSSGF
jgi:NADH-quinone oxidoreductase subunit N